MKKFYFLLAFLIFCWTSIDAQQRYLEPIFDGYDLETVVYSTNISVLTGAPQAVNLELDIYTPAGDTETNRPLFLYFYTGNFLPNPLNGSTGGTRTDSTVLEIVDRLTALGYVVAVVEYRKGWNPLGDLDTRISTLINAAYRGVQDARTAVRFFRKDAVDNGNQWGIDPDNIAYFGQGTGGYISFAAATLDNYTDILIPKFFGPDITGDGNPDPYVIEPIHGNIYGTANAVASLANIVTYDDGTPINSDVQLTVNLGGALADTSWISANNPPMVSFHVPTDGFAPYMEDVLIVPTTGDLIVEVQGSYLVQWKANQLGLNEIFKDAELSDPFSQVANSNNDGLEGLYPLIRPIWTNPLNGQPAPENAPWEWWNPAPWSQVPHPLCPEGIPLNQCNFHIINSITNQDMSPEKGRTYIDTIIGYLAPRAYLAFGLSTNVTEIEAQDVDFNFFPNPATSAINFSSASEMRTIELYDINGRLLVSQQNVNSLYYSLNRNELSSGIYFARVYFDEGVLVKRVMFQ